MACSVHPGLRSRPVYCIPLHSDPSIGRQTQEQRYLGVENLRSAGVPGHNLSNCALPRRSDGDHKDRQLEMALRVHRGFRSCLGWNMPLLMTSL